MRCFTAATFCLTNAIVQPTLAAGPAFTFHKLTQEGNGEALCTVTATRKLALHRLAPGSRSFHIKTADLLAARALIIHSGGSGSRIACGIVE